MLAISLASRLMIGLSVFLTISNYSLLFFLFSIPKLRASHVFWSLVYFMLLYHFEVFICDELRASKLYPQGECSSIYSLENISLYLNCILEYFGWSFKSINFIIYLIHLWPTLVLAHFSRHACIQIYSDCYRFLLFCSNGWHHVCWEIQNCWFSKLLLMLVLSRRIFNFYAFAFLSFNFVLLTWKLTHQMRVLWLNRFSCVLKFPVFTIYQKMGNSIVDSGSLSLLYWQRYCCLW
jgi:hypothetical protein